jgi:hypothetical protein
LLSPPPPLRPPHGSGRPATLSRRELERWLVIER